MTKYQNQTIKRYASKAIEETLLVNARPNLTAPLSCQKPAGGAHLGHPYIHHCADRVFDYQKTQ